MPVVNAGLLAGGEHRLRRGTEPGEAVR